MPTRSNHWTSIDSSRSPVKSNTTGSTSSSSPGADARRFAGAEPQHILLIDDSPEDREVYKELLGEWGDFTFTEVASGCEGLALAVEGHFSCIILDYLMPDMDGFELLERYLAVRADADPVVFVTGRGDERLAVRAFKLGACDYVPKADLSSPGLYRAVRSAVERRRIERSLARSREDLREARVKAESASHAKSVFLANMSHEIRTPLTAILGFTELMAEGVNDVEREGYLGAVRRNGQSLMRIINDVLDMSKIEAGHLQVERLAVDLPGLLTDVVRLFQGEAAQRGLSLVGTWDADLAPVVETDPTRLRQILHNVIGNALKFTERGRVEVIAATEVRDGFVHLRIDVTDTGVGIPETLRAQIFEAFQQADVSVNRRFGGTGLGLPLCRHLAQALGGRFELSSSEEGEGSTFTLALKLRPGRRRERAKARARGGKVDHLRGANILVVEDSLDSQDLIKAILVRQGARVATANNGAEGLNQAARQEFDLIITDLQMPIMGGTETAARLRGAGYRKPIMGLSAHAFSDERDRALAKDFDAYVTKPIAVADLLGQVSGLLAGLVGRPALA